ncbi:MAG: glutamate--tRNA ligase [Bacteroidetes bacterium]|nr:glutamate--tRNA ligase [Bacteroidota bacterium]
MSNIRVRFAPSPTGALHIGGVRTALYNYLFTKKHGGTFVLRIEDTDQGRYVPGAENYIIESLHWCGIMPTEGQGIGGPHAPYRQSDRKDIYQKYALELVANGKAYYAFDTPEELEAARNEAAATGNHNFKYDTNSRKAMKTSLNLPAEEVQRRLDAGNDYVIRLKVPENEVVTFTDLIRGEVSFATSELDDKVLMKSDGMPTYHLANIVDDHLMEITHVIRGEEWLPSTGHHVLLYRAFGWEATMPAFSHLPLILKPSPDSYLTKSTIPTITDALTEEFFKKNEKQDFAIDREKTKNQILQILQDAKSISAQLKENEKDSPDKILLKEFLKDSLFGKLSKRDGARLGFPVFPINWEGSGDDSIYKGFSGEGFLPEAVVNFLAFLGWNPGTEQEIFSLTELSEAFSLEKISRSGARFDYNKAKWYNQQYLHAADDAELARLVQPLVEAKGYQVSDEYLAKACHLMKGRATFLPELVEQAPFLFGEVQTFDNDNIAKRWKPESRSIFEALANHLKAQPEFVAAPLEESVKAFMNEQGKKPGEIMPILRLALAGTMQGPGVFEMMELLGRDASLERLARAFNYFDAQIG